jgi:hypothetical protein
MLGYFQSKFCTSCFEDESKCGVWCHCLLSVTLLLGLINTSRVTSSTAGSVGVCLGLHFDFSTVNLFPHKVILDSKSVYSGSAFKDHVVDHHHAAQA